jgi:hypothetical protein
MRLLIADVLGAGTKATLASVPTLSTMRPTTFLGCIAS